MLITKQKLKILHNFLFASILICSVFLPVVPAQNGVSKKTEFIKLGESSVKINTYEKKGTDITFVSVHHNEWIAIKAAKEIIEKNGGRLIELESVSENGTPLRRVRFKFNGRDYSFDPNRIYTENGRICNNPTPEVLPLIKQFAADLLKIILPQEGNRLRKGEKFLVALHNNGDVDDETRGLRDRERDLTAFAYIKGGKIQHPLHGAFEEQVEGVFISNVEDDEDNFFFITTPNLLGFLAQKGFNVVLQKPAAKLQAANCEIDDGSLSVYFGQRHLPYINIEADNRNGEFRQKQMIETVYQLLQKD